MAVACKTGYCLLERGPAPAATMEARHRDEEWAILLADPIGFQRYAKPSDAPLQDKLASILLQATHAVREYVRSFKPGEADAVIDQLTELLSVDAWDDDDAFLSITSLRTLLRTITRLGAGVGDLTIARNGNVVSTWSNEDHVLRVEAHPEGTVSWTILHPRGARPRHEHTPQGTIDDLVGVAASWGRTNGNPQRR